MQRGQHNMLAGRPGVIVGTKRSGLVVRCTEVGTLFCGQEYLTPRVNVRIVTS